MREGNCLKRIISCLLCICIMVCMCGCGASSGKKDWTYELLEEELGGIIEADFESVKSCLNLIEKKEYVVCGYITKKSCLSVIGVDLYNITITDDENYVYNGNTIEVCVTENAFSKVNEGDFIYASGKIEYNSYTGNTISMMCHTGGYISSEPIDGSISVKNYIENAMNIFKDTYFKTEGFIIQDGTYSNGTPIYRFYESEKAYKENKYGYITIEFYEEQHNINGKIVTIMGKPGSNISNGLTQCSIVNEK